MKYLFSIWVLAMCFSLEAQNSYYVSPVGLDVNNGSLNTPWKTIQYGVNQLTPGDVLFIREGSYSEKIDVDVSGTASAYITIKNYNFENVIIDVKDISNDLPIIWTDNAYLRIEGLHLTNNIFNYASGLMLQGSAHHIDIINNKISNIRFSSNPDAPVNDDTNAVPLNIWADSAQDSIYEIRIIGNEVFDNQTGFSENITGGGNFSTFIIEDNLVHDNTNIGIDIVGNYGICPNPKLDQGRYGIIRNNTVYNCVSAYSPSAGIYIDGGRDILVENNISHHNGYGGEIGCEENGNTSNITFRNNLFYKNIYAGMHMGGYDENTTGVVVNSIVSNNTFYLNDTGANYNGEITFTKSNNCTIENNIFYISSQNVFLYFDRTQSNLILDYNLVYAEAGSESIEVVGNYEIEGLSNFYNISSYGIHSSFGDPFFVSTAENDFHIGSASSAIDRGNPAYIPTKGEVDLYNATRVNNAIIDCGAAEYQSPTGLAPLKNNLYFTLYPNPFHNRLVIKGNESMALLRLYSINGELISSYEINNSYVKLNLSNLQKGSYFLMIYNTQDKLMGSKKLIKN